MTKANLESKWYSYAEKKWANAVILTGEDTYIEGKEIPEDKIESYFVWIPKYSYQLWDLGNYSSLTSVETSKVHTIPIKFGLENTSDAKTGECTTPMTSGGSGKCKIGDYMTPPAFISMGTNGLWVGKFETGYKGATSTASAEVNANDASKVQIKPNVYSWRNITISNAFYSSYNYKRELDSHMMKNTEWGAVAYLQHSVYGSATSVRINNNKSLITGYAGVEEPTVGYKISGDGNQYEKTVLGVDGTYTINFLNPKSPSASTTGNYSGIYDMSGGSSEYLMSVHGIITSGSAGFNSNNKPEIKYYEEYNANGTYYKYQYRILGDVTGEVGPFQNIKDPDGNYRSKSSWYYDSGSYQQPAWMWIARGGGAADGIDSGMFAFSGLTGGQHTGFSFRIVLAIK